eukprot:CAMPEP_0206485200 /NCGR_PEP_ID=MMETSP0324_2-20121206/40391_1 /ASSEMBLY_ACC=CAM_ASM_000836 /TAXON_ID=2866 /ORGANISM="Crypthecodinium cohnii, Strain Seligo" /LENGTH=595 /DNA_ID=CAMNT_0053963419 /DNA_START=105 /DNA_END=1893 /DNA_ORIENTATION=-
MCGEVAQMKSSTATTSSSNNNSTDLVNGQTAPNVTTNMTTTTTTPMARTGSATHNVTFKSQSTSSNDSDSDSDGCLKRTSRVVIRRSASPATEKAEADTSDLAPAPYPVQIKNTFVEIPLLKTRSQDELDLRRFASEPASIFARRLCSGQLPQVSEKDVDVEEDDDVDLLELGAEDWKRMKTAEAWDHDTIPEATWTESSLPEVKVDDCNSDDDAFEPKQEWTRLKTGDAWAEASVCSEEETTTEYSSGHSERDAHLDSEQGAKPAVSVASASTTISLAATCIDTRAPIPATWSRVRSVLMHNVPVSFTTQTLLDCRFGAPPPPPGGAVRIEFTAAVQAWQFKLAFDGKHLCGNSNSLAPPTSSEPLLVVPCQGAARDNKAAATAATAANSSNNSNNNTININNNLSIGNTSNNANASTAAAVGSSSSALAPPTNWASSASVAGAARRRRKGVGSLIDQAKAQQQPGVFSLEGNLSCDFPSASMPEMPISPNMAFYAVPASSISSLSSATNNIPINAAAAASAVATASLGSLSQLSSNMASPAPAQKANSSSSNSKSKTSGKFIFCTSCGGKAKVGFRFCSFCGSSMPQGRTEVC